MFRVRIEQVLGQREANNTHRVKKVLPWRKIKKKQQQITYSIDAIVFTTTTGFSIPDIWQTKSFCKLIGACCSELGQWMSYRNCDTSELRDKTLSLLVIKKVVLQGVFQDLLDVLPVWLRESGGCRVMLKLPLCLCLMSWNTFDSFKKARNLSQIWISRISAHRHFSWIPKVSKWRCTGRSI